jgi:hypothetical protein
MSLKLPFEGQAAKSEMVVRTPEEEYERAQEVLCGEIEIDRTGF